MTEHAQVSIEGVDVDAGIAPLLSRLWRHGIDTSASCEDWGGLVWIGFPDHRNAERFLDLVLEGQSGTELYWRARGFRDAMPPTWEQSDSPAWEWTLHVGDRAIGQAKTLTFMWPSVKFPTADLAAVHDLTARGAMTARPVQSFGHPRPVPHFSPRPESNGGSE